MKEFKPKKNWLPPSMDADLKGLYKQRDALRKRYMCTRDDALRDEFQSLATKAKLPSEGGVHLE